MSEECSEYDRQLRSWYVSELTRLGFNRIQREVLIERLEARELNLAEFRDLIDKRGWTTEQAFLWAS